jgi:NitT/TauT family transport system substrate-binding protein
MLARLLLLAAVALAVGCGGDGDGDGDGGGSASGEAKPATMRVGLIPIVGVAPVYLGIEKGFYRAEKLTLKPELSAGGAEIVPSVMSGSLDIGYSNTTSLLIAAERGLPLRLLTGGVVGASDPKRGWAQIMVAEDSDVRSPADLAGKTIAVNTLKNIADTTLKEALTKKGVDAEGIRLLEIDFPDMIAALKAGRVDAIFEVEPFVTAARSQGARAVLAPYVETSPNLPISNFFATEKYIRENGDVVERFVRATQRSLAYAGSHPDEVRQVLVEYTEIPAPVRREMVLPGWDSKINREGIELLDRLDVKYGIYDKPVNLDELIYE